MQEMTKRAESTQYIPKLTLEEIKENHKHFAERVNLYKKKGLDFFGSRKFILEKARPLEGSILEIGAGTGYTTLALAKAQYLFTSVDKDEGALKTTTLNLAYENLLSNVELYVMDGTSMFFNNGSFKNIVVVNLFHHIKGINKLLSEIDRVLCADGKIVLADFNKKGMEIVEEVHRLDGRAHENTLIAKEHVYSYFSGLAYRITGYGSKYHWVLIGKKLIQK